LKEFGGLRAGAHLGEAFTLFARIDEAKFLAEQEAKRAAAEKAAAKAAEPIDHEEEIGIDTFAKTELRTAQILACEPVPKAKKLLKLQVDLGYEKRQIVSGIAKFYTPEQLIGKKVAIVANLAPAKLCGVESFGMLLASGEEQVRVIFLDPETPLGERIH
jgi:methionyl-tRNA synthetase